MQNLNIHSFMDQIGQWVFIQRYKQVRWQCIPSHPIHFALLFGLGQSSCSQILSQLLLGCHFELISKLTGDFDHVICCAPVSSFLTPPYWKTRRPWGRGWNEIYQFCIFLTICLNCEPTSLHINDKQPALITYLRI